MLSARRFWCGLIVFTVLIFGLMIEPVRLYVQRLAIEFAFEGSFSATTCQVHLKQEVLELSQLEASRIDDDSHVLLTAKRAFLKVNLPALLDKRIISPKVKLQGVRLELLSLDNTPQSSSLPVYSWQASLADLLSAMQWDKLQNECESLLASDNLLAELESKMRGWILRSQQINFHAKDLADKVQSFSNPLRHLSEIRGQLEQIDQLRAEQDKLQVQFSTANQLLTEKLKVIHSTSARDVESLRTNTERDLVALRTKAAEQIVLEWSTHLLSRQMMIGRSVAILSQAETTCPFNTNVRNVAAHDTPFSFSGIEANGIFIHSHQETPFNATGEIAFSQKFDYQLVPQAAWAIKCRSNNIATRLDVASLEESQGWHILSASNCYELGQQSPSDIQNLASCEILAASSEIFTFNASMQQNLLKGTARMNIAMASAFSQLPCSSNADLDSTDCILAPTSETWIEFTISGSAADPAIDLVSPLPTDFIERITSCIQRRLETQRIGIEEKLAAAVSSKISELKNRLNPIVQQGQQTVSKQRALLSEMHLELEKKLLAREGFEYARLPTKTTATR